MCLSNQLVGERQATPAAARSTASTVEGGGLPSDPMPPSRQGPGFLHGAELRSAMEKVTIAWLFGAVWATAISGATFTRFVGVMQPSNAQWGLLTAIPFLTTLLSLPAALLNVRTGKRKRIFLWSLFLNRYMWFFLAIVPLLIMWRYGAAAATAAMACFIPMYFLMHSGQGIGGPAWTAWMSDMVPARIRGAYFAKRRQLGLVPAIPAALLAGWALDYFATGSGFSGQLRVMLVCAIIFCIAGVLGMLDIGTFIFIPDAPQEPRRGAEVYKALLHPLRDRQFVWWALFIGILSFALAPMGQWVTLYLIEKVKVKNWAVQGMLLVAPMLAQWLVLPIVGKCADRMGKKPLLAIASLGMVPVGVGWCLVSPVIPWLGYVLGALGAGLWVGVEVANLQIILEMGEERADGRGGSSYIAINGVIINISACLGCLAFGWVAEWLKDWHWDIGLKTIDYFDILFVASAALRLIASVIFLPGIREPDARSPKEALQFVTANIYNNLFNGLWQSLRQLKLIATGRLRNDDADAQ